MSDQNLAQMMQAAAHVADDLLVWAICRNPKDYPGMFTVRAHSMRGDAPTDFVMVASTLDSARALLPNGLTYMSREDSDDPVIVESWV